MQTILASHTWSRKLGCCSRVRRHNMRVLLVLLLAGLLIVAACASPARLHEAKRKHKDGDAARNRPDANEKNQPSIEDAAVADDDDDDDDDVDDVDDVDDDVSKTSKTRAGSTTAMRERNAPSMRWTNRTVAVRAPVSNQTTQGPRCAAVITSPTRRNVTCTSSGVCVRLGMWDVTTSATFTNTPSIAASASNERNDLGEEYIPLEKEAERKSEMKLVNPVIWKFCDLDKSSDRKLSRHELTQLKAPLVTLERCISPFLDNCDVDGDHYITLPEWGACLHLEEDEIKFKCKKYHNHHN
ncbi:PREDICTED: ATPase family AAA domain-containing protein 2-like isoform X2 [Priapulus caudatus]|uniref:ATPase family AAA domain-containing protein 2-like isoform X2 n=1 Tax=Priapulus caudatus TaxID=37621 RepID=A0ABM1EE99_PRICU|nr:PREDICTED: ATPase family AAA domain-containing protein 2-like isoform X2 [Priapulus caudatus]